MHYFGIFGMLQVFLGKHPARVSADDLAVIIKSRPVFNIHKISIFQRLSLIIFYGRTFGEFLIQLISGGMGDREVMAHTNSPFSEAIGHSMWNSLDMRTPSKYYLGFSFLLGKLTD